MGSFTVSVRGVSLDSCIEARAVPVGVGGRGGVLFCLVAAKSFTAWSRGRQSWPSFLSPPSISGSLFGGAIRAEDIAGWGV